MRALKQPGLTRDETLQVRTALAEAWFQQDDIRQAPTRSGDPPDERERLHPARLSELWRLHGKLAIAKGEPSRGIALLGRALKQAERAHDSRAIGLTHYELGLCYRHVGDTAIVREHIAQAASALHAAGDQPQPRAGPLAERRHAGAGRPSRRSDGGAAPGRAPRADGPRRRRRRDRLRQPGERRDDAAPPRSGAGAGRAQRRAAGGVRHAARPRHRAGLARPDQRPARQPAPRRAGAQPRARRAQPAAVHARDDRRRLRHAGADSPRARQSRRREPRLQRSREAYGDSNQLVPVVGAGARGAARAAPRRRVAGAARRRRRSPGRRRAVGVCDAGGTDRRRGAARVRAAGRGRAAADGGQRPAAGGRDEQRLGRVPAAARARARRRPGAPPRRTTTSGRA